MEHLDLIGRSSMRDCTTHSRLIHSSSVSQQFDTLYSLLRVDYRGWLDNLIARSPA